MGTIVIEEHDKSGLEENTLIPVFNISQLLKRTEDAATTTSPGSLSLQGNTSLLRIYTDEIHRIALTSGATGDNGNYFTTIVGWNDLAVNQGSTIYYRTDA